MATEIVHTIRASGGDYTTLSAWEAAQQRDLVATDEIAVAECYDDWPSGLNDVVEIFGWTTDSTRFVNVRVADGHKHGGQIDAGFRIISNGGATGCVYNRTSYTLLEDLNVENTSPANSGHAIYNVQPITISRCIAKGNNRLYTGAFTIGSSNTTCINCLAVNTKRGFRVYILSPMHSIQLLNCTSANCSEYGFWVHASVPDITVKNCVSYNAGVTNFSGLYEAASTNNAASDGSTNTPPGSNPLTVDITSADFVDAANGDFRLSATSQLKGAGFDVGITEDIQGHPLTLTGINYFPIGAFRGTVEAIHKIRASGGDYTTLSAWEAAQQRDLVAADEIAVAECYNDWPSGLDDQVSISGWVTSSGTYPIVKAAQGQGHGGVIGAGFSLSKNTSGVIFALSSEYSVVEGIEINTSLVSYTYSTSLGVSVLCRASNCIIRGLPNKLHTGVRLYLGAGSNLAIAPRIENSIVIDSKKEGIYSNSGGSTHVAIADNCTVVNCGNAFLTANNELRLRNCVAYNNTSNYPNTYHTASTNNAASDGSTNTPPGSNPLTVDITSADFVDAANGDFSLSAGSQLINAGADLSSDFTTDIVGTVRG